MKIAMLSTHFAEYVCSLAVKLSEDNDVLLLVEKQNFDNEITDYNCMSKFRGKIIMLDNCTIKNPYKCLQNTFIIISELRAFQPDVVHCQEAYRDYSAFSIFELRKFPLVLTIHDHIPHTGTDSNIRGRTLYYRKYMRKIPDAVIVHGQLIKAEAEEIMPWIRNRVFAVPLGIMGEQVASVRSTSDENTLLFFGRINKYKGLGYLLEALKILEKRNIPIKLVIAGRGADLDHYRDEINCNPNIELHERFIPSNEIPELFVKATIVVLPYIDATQSAIAAYAINYARPVVATDVGSLKEMIKDGYNGLIVPPRDSFALADAIHRLLIKPDLLYAMSENARQLAKDEFSWSNIARKTSEVYEFAIKRHRAKTRKIA